MGSNYQQYKLLTGIWQVHAADLSHLREGEAASPEIPICGIERFRKTFLNKSFFEDLYDGIQGHSTVCLYVGQWLSYIAAHSVLNPKGTRQSKLING